MADLSPAALAALEAYWLDLLDCRPGKAHGAPVAAAFRALANHQPQPRTIDGPLDHWDPDDRTRRELRNIADELEGRPLEGKP